MGSTVSIEFRGDRLLGIETDLGAFVYIKPIVERMGLDWSGQLQRLKRNPTLREGMVVMPIPPEFGSADNAATFLRLDLFHGWLFTVDSARVKPEIRPALLDYQREAYAVLAAAFARPSRAPAEVLPSPAAHLPESIAARLVTECRMSFGTPASRALWFRLGLPVVAEMKLPPRQADLFSYSREA